MTTRVGRRSQRRANSIGEATQLCLEFAMKKHNRSAKRIADLMGAQLHTLYKWLGETRMPINMIAPFEAACGVTYVTEYLCAQAHLLAVEMPSGRKLTQTDVMQLQKHFSETTSMLIDFNDHGTDGEETTAALTVLMGEIGWHRANVERCTQPDLPLFGGEAG